MNFRFTVVETALNRAEFRWKWLRFLRLTLTLGIVLASVLFLLGGAILAGFLSSKVLATALCVGAALTGFLAWLAILLCSLLPSPRRPWLAAALEKANLPLLDRLNTLVFLERHPPHGPTESFARRIAKQTQTVLDQGNIQRPFGPQRPLAHLLAFLVALMATLLLYELYSPWSRLVAAVPRSKAPVALARDKTLELMLPPTNSVEQNQAWGEVRITDPGTDLRVTKVDVVPLQIEAAANQALGNVNWVSAINGANETTHPLPPPSEPHYALYQPTLYLDELDLSDWDVMTYYAKANTQSSNSFASQVYFLEVRPFREDILKLPGGENGEAYRYLSELTGLINRQQHVIRQTHQHVQQPPPSEKLQAQDRKKLADAEGDLSNSTQHLYAQMAAELENKPIGDALDNLAQAQQSLDKAGKLLADNGMSEAGNRERQALSDLVAARKMFQKAVSDNPKDFAENPPEDTSKVLDQMAEFRNETKVAQDFVRKTLDQQQEVQRKARSANETELSRLAQQEDRLQKALESFRQQHPQPFSGVQTQAALASQSLSNAAKAFHRNADPSQNAPPGTTTAAAREATQQLRNLNDAMTGQAADRQLADAYKLKQLLDQQAAAFDRRSKTNSGMSDQDLYNTILAARKTLDQLKSAAERDPTRDAFGQPLRDALNDQNRGELNSQLSRLWQAEEEADKQQGAADARDGLGKVSKAFTESEPKSLQNAQQHDSLKPNAQESFSQGMAELDSLIRQLENNRPVPSGDQRRQGRQALADLQDGLRERSGNDDKAASIIQRLDQLLKAQTPLEAATLKALLAELQNFSVETSAQLASKEDKPDVNNIDPDHLPPAYRGRIQKYFEKLSEK